MFSVSQKIARLSLNKVNSVSYNIQLARIMHSLMKNQAYINGKWTNADDNKVFSVYNPSNLKVITQVPDMNKDDCQRAIDAANDAFYCKDWHNATAKDRSVFLKVNK